MSKFFMFLTIILFQSSAFADLKYANLSGTYVLQNETGPKFSCEHKPFVLIADSERHNIETQDPESGTRISMFSNINQGMQTYYVPDVGGLTLGINIFKKRTADTIGEGNRVDLTIRAVWSGGTLVSSQSLELNGDLLTIEYGEPKQPYRFTQCIYKKVSGVK